MYHIISKIIHILGRDMYPVKQASSPVSYSCDEVWSQVLFHPSVESYEQILAGSNVKAWHATLWVAVSSLLVALVTEAFNKFHTLEVLITIPVITLNSFLILTAGYHLSAKVMKGSGTYKQMVYACGAFFAPIFFIFSLSYFIIKFFGITAETLSWVFGSDVLLVGIYSIYQIIYAIRAVENISGRRAFLSFVISSVAVIILYLAILFFLLVLMI